MLVLILVQMTVIILGYKVQNFESERDIQNQNTKKSKNNKINLMPKLKLHIPNGLFVFKANSNANSTS